MPITFQALDTEFAASTGSNVNSGANSSTFDHPPTASKGLVITSNDGDPSPYVFSPGDSYDLIWNDMGGNRIVNDAVVIRSDPVSYKGDDGFAVVFEGYDQNGELVQVVWTPDFDLEEWYFDKFDKGHSPGFWTRDQSGATYAATCFASGTRIATPDGERRIEGLRAGDRVLVRGGRVRRLLWAGAQRVPGHGAMAPVVFDPGAVGNVRRLVLSQQHRIALRSARAELLFGTPEVLVPALSFLDGVSVRFEPRQEVTWHHILFDRHEIVLAEGAECESLFLGDVARGVLGGSDPDATVPETDALYPALRQADSAGGAMETALPVLRPHEAAVLLGRVPVPVRGRRTPVLAA